MACICGSHHTITLSDNGIVHSFGHNKDGQLGLRTKKKWGQPEEENYIFRLPTPIPNLPKIKNISCGNNFSFCLDFDGFLWSFGGNMYGQLGTGNTTNSRLPQKVLDIPPVQSVHCGCDHTMMLTNDSNLWSCGCNNFAQLCLGNKESQCKPQKTAFSNILKISVGGNYSMFQIDTGEIFGCGYNSSGELALGTFETPQVTPVLISNLPSDIVDFVCGYSHNLFLDSEGNVYSCGENCYGQLGHNKNQYVVNQIPNIPPIQSISIVLYSSFLIDFEGNVWSFGHNGKGQLGHGDATKINVPTKIESLKDIQQIAYGHGGYHFLAKDSQNKIFIAGGNDYGQLGTGDTQSVPTLKELDSQYSTIWGCPTLPTTRAKSARK